ncbi:MAG: beta-eliminating lyase-related protein [Coriobacteriia bacterium]|nr:beta-eliminating lyase-related protein [Coriobacteriia bacterium]
MIHLMNDYDCVGHPVVLEALRGHQDKRFSNYGSDEKTAEAKAVLLGLLEKPGADVHFIPTGTLTNLTALSAFLRPHEAVIAPVTAHIFAHETGAIEATGHKVLSVETKDGKLGPEDISSVVEVHTDEHMVKPRLVYISQTTEFGGVYTSAELRALRGACDEYGLLLYIDGARLAYALASSRCDFGLPEIAELADAFYLGGAKIGLLFGEALVICNPQLQDDFRFLIKQRGGLMGKGFLLGIQFLALLEDGLFLELGEQANSAAAALYEGLKSLGYEFEIVTESNQVFPIVNKDELARLSANIEFEAWNRLSSTRSSIRFVTSWQTTEDDIEAVLTLMTRSA